MYYGNPAIVTVSKAIIGMSHQSFSLHHSYTFFTVSCTTLHFYYSGLLFLLLLYAVPQLTECKVLHFDEEVWFPAMFEFTLC